MKQKFAAKKFAAKKFAPGRFAGVGVTVAYAYDNGLDYTVEPTRPHFQVKVTRPHYHVWAEDKW